MRRRVCIRGAPWNIRTLILNVREEGVLLRSGGCRWDGHMVLDRQVQRSTFGISTLEARGLTDLRRNPRIVCIFIFIPRVEVQELSLQVEGPRRVEEFEDRAFRKEEVITSDAASKSQVDGRTKIGLLQPEHRQRRFPGEPPLPVCPHLRLPQRTRHLKTRLFIHTSFLCLDCKRPRRFRRRVLRYSLLSSPPTSPQNSPSTVRQTRFLPLPPALPTLATSLSERPMLSFLPSDLDPNRAPLFLPSNLLAPSVISSVARQAIPRPGNSHLFLTLVSTLVFRRGLLPGPPGSGYPPKYSIASPRNPPRRSTNSTLPFCACVDFVQDSLYPNELKVYKPTSKIVPTSPRLHPSSTLKSSITAHLSV
jgi:hypothetical protein